MAEQGEVFDGRLLAVLALVQVAEQFLDALYRHEVGPVAFGGFPGRRQHFSTVARGEHHRRCSRLVGKGVIGPADNTFLLAQLLGSGAAGSGLLYGFLMVDKGCRIVGFGTYIETRMIFGLYYLK